MASYIAGVIERTWWQLFQLFAVPFALAVALQVVGWFIRSRGYWRWGRAYLYFISPGVACHEFGHAAGCLITGTRIHKIVPFTLEEPDKRLGYIVHSSRRGLLGGVATFLISSGPIWFGCLVIGFLTWLFGRVVHVANYRDYFASDIVPGALEYGCGMVKAVGGFAAALFVDGTWGWGFAVWLYLAFCIASEIGLSGVDLQYMWRGAVSILVIFLLLNLIPPIGRLLSIGLFIIQPYLFKFHVLMLSALVLNAALFLVMKAVARVMR